MSTKSKAKGTRAETEAVRYLQQYWPRAERRALSGGKDKGDIINIPRTAGEVKAAKDIRLREWQRETLEEMANAEADHCFLVVKIPYKNVSKWDFWVPAYQVGLEDLGLTPPENLPEVCRWIRMDFELGRDVLRRMIAPFGR